MKKTAQKSRIAFIGPGNLGRVLALALHRAGYTVTEIISRETAPSQRRARAFAKRIGARAVTLENATLDCDVIWLTVPDSAIADSARALAKAAEWRGRIALHASGALAASVMAPLKRAGAAIGSAHPMNSFVAGSKPDFAGVPFALEGDAPAIAAAKKMVTDIGAEALSIRAEEKVLYHAFGAFSSPLLIALLEAAERVGHAAGVKNPRAVNARILRQTLENYLEKGADAAFSGPLARGDSEVVRQHLNALKRIPGARETYLALAQSALRGLPAKNPETLWQVLK